MGRPRNPRQPQGLKAWRTFVQLTQRQLADEIGVSQQTIARWEGGDDIPSKHLKDLAIALACPIEALVPQQAAGSFDDRLAARRRAEDHDFPYGTARIIWVGTGADPMTAFAPKTRSPSEYPIGVGEMRRLYGRLQRRDDFASWFMFETLDDRVVLVNRQQLESFVLASENAEAMPEFEHPEVYKALNDWRLRTYLEGRADADSDDAPYSAALIKRCRELIDGWGWEAFLNRFESITLEAINGVRRAAYVDNQVEWEQIAALVLDIDGIDARDELPMNEWMVDLYSEGYERSSLYRLGALRLIEIPLVKYAEALERMFPDTEQSEPQAPAARETDSAGETGDEHSDNGRS
jgi:transcriptional regulator with XRE-family HTH domain